MSLHMCHRPKMGKWKRKGESAGGREILEIGDWRGEAHGVEPLRGWKDTKIAVRSEFNFSGLVWSRNAVEGVLSMVWAEQEW